MSRHGTSTNFTLRDALLHLLDSGRAITTTELRTRLADDDRFPRLTHEAVYRHLEALARQGRVRRLRHHNCRRIYWTRRTVGSSALQALVVS